MSYSPDTFFLTKQQKRLTFVTMTLKHEFDPSNPESVSEENLDRNSSKSECALGFFRYNGPGEIDYYAFARKFQRFQGKYRGGGGRGLVMNAMTHARAMEILHGAATRPRRIRMFGPTHRVDLSTATNLEVAHVHSQGRSVDAVLDGIKETGANILYVESIGANPGALNFRGFRDTFGDIEPGRVHDTYLRIFVDNHTGKDPVSLQQEFNVKKPGPVVMSWSSIKENSPGLMCYRLAGGDEEFDEFFRPDIEEFAATDFESHSRFPTQQSKPGVEDSQPRVQDHIVSMHNGDLVNAFAIKQRLRDPNAHAAELRFFAAYGKPGAPFKKMPYRHIAGVDSSVVAKVHVYLEDCCKRHGIDPFTVSLLERPPSLAQISAMPPQERKFFMLARLAFPEMSYQGSAATILRTDDYARLTPDKTRTLWIARDHNGHVYVASNGGAITNACHPDDLEFVRPVEGNEAIDVDMRTGEIINRGMEFRIPQTLQPGIFIPGIGFDPGKVKELNGANGNGSGIEAKRKPFEGKDESLLPKEFSNQFGLYGYEAVDLKRLVKYGNSGTYLATGLGNADPDGVMKRTTLISGLTSTHQAFIVSPGRDNRIEFSARTLFRNGEDEPILLRSPILAGSKALSSHPDGAAVLKQIAQEYGTRVIDDLQKAIRIKTTYRLAETLEEGLKRVAEEAKSAALSGVQNIILDDTFADGEIPMPPSVICAVVHNKLRETAVQVDFGGETVAESLRSRVSLIGNFRGATTIEELKECIMHGADAVCPELAFEATMGLFGQDFNDLLKERRAQLIRRGINALCGMEEDLAIASGSSGFHDINAMRGNAPGMEYELGVDGDLNKMIGNLPGMKAGGIDLKTLDLFLRSRFTQFGGRQQIGRNDLLSHEGGWERWHEKILHIIDRMARMGAAYNFDPQEYEGIPVVTIEDMVRIAGLKNFQNFSDEEIKDIDLRVLDFIGVMVAHMSIGANNIETWVSILSALYEIRHEAEKGAIPFLNKKETLIMAGIGEGGIAAELRLFLSHICGQYASGRFGLETNDGDIFDRGHLMKEGLLRMKGAKEGAFAPDEISNIERLILGLVKSQHIVEDIAAMEEGNLNLLCRFTAVVCAKNAQDAKRGYGGMMAKTIFLIARIRGVTPHDAVKSFFNHADGDSIEELRQRIFALMREVSGEIPELGDQEVCVWSKDALDPYALSNMFGEVKSGAVMIDHDWRGGTGNRPVGTKRASHPWLVETARFDALDRGMLGMMTMNWMSSNRTPVDAIRNILLGNIDGILVATSLLRAMKCIAGQCRNCNTGLCPPLLTDQRSDRRQKLYQFDSSAPEDADLREVNAKTQKERAKRFILAFIRTMKVLLKNIGANSIAQAKGRCERLTVDKNIEVEGAGWIRQVKDHPYDEATVERACSVSARFNVEKFVGKETFPAEKLANALQTYLSISVDGVPHAQLSRNSFLVVGDIANVFPQLSKSEQIHYSGFVKNALARLEESYRRFLRDSGEEIPSSFSREDLLERYHRLDHLTGRDHQEFLERLITAYRLLELMGNFSLSRDEHKYKDEFFARTEHRSQKRISIKSPRAIVSQESGFTIDRYRGVQRVVASAVVEHMRKNTDKKPLVITIDQPLNDRDMGILSCLGSLYHASPEKFDATVESIELHLKNGVAGHNLGAMVNGNYLFGRGNGKIKLRILVGSSDKHAHADGSVGMSANGATIEVNGYAGDCAGAYASDLDLSMRGASVKLGMGAKGDTFIYHHEPLSDVAGIGMNGNATILCAGARRTGESRRAIAKAGLGGDMQGLSKIILAAPAEEIKHSQILGVGAIVKKLSRIDKEQAAAAYSRHYPRYEKGAEPPSFDAQAHSKVVSELYFRNLITSVLVYDFYRMRDDFSLEDQIESAAGELLEINGIDDSDPANEPLLRSVTAMIHDLRNSFVKDSAALIARDADGAFLDARKRALEFLNTFKIPAPKAS